MTSTTKTLLIILGVLILGSGVWYLVGHWNNWPQKSAAPREDLELAQVTVALPSDITGFYPAGEDETYTFQVNRHIFEPLVAMDRNMRVVPALASSWINLDDTTWLFTLRSDVKFHDGSNFTAADVKFTIDKALKEEIPSTMPYLASIKSVEAIDDSKVEIKTTSSNPVLLNQLAQVLILSKNYKEGENPNGTGPYKFASYDKGKTISLVANENYYGGAPKVKKAVFKVIEDEEERISDLKSGAVDVAIYGFQKDATSEITADANLDSRSVSSVVVSVLLMNQSKGDLTKKEVRQAIRKALNLETIASKVISGAKPASQLVSQLIFGFNPDIKVVQQDQETAKATLAQSTLANEKLTMIDLPGSEEVDKEIVAELKSAGVNVQLETVDAEQVFARLSKGDFAFLRTSFSSDTGDAFDALSSLVHSPDPEKNLGSYNFGYTNKEVDKLIDDSQVLDQNTRQQKLQEAMKIAMEEVAAIPLYIVDYKSGVRKNIVWQPRPTRQVFVFEMAGRELEIQNQ